eukprot:119692-Amphidinium_carterae.1
MSSKRVIINYCLLEVITNSAGTRTSPSELVDEMASYCYLVLPEPKVKRVLEHKGETMVAISKELHACCNTTSGRRLFWSALKRLSVESVSSHMSEAREALSKLSSVTEAAFEKQKTEAIAKITELLQEAGLDERRDVTI